MKQLNGLKNMLPNTKQTSTTFKEIVDFIRVSFQQPEGFIPLHEPKFIGNEKQYVASCIDSTFVSSVGSYVNQFEEMIKEITGARYAIATVNGTAALHIALLLANVTQNDLVITQPLTFIATCNAISYLGADPLFVDINPNTLGLSPEKLEQFLQEETTINDEGFCIHKVTRKKIKACVPMHTFGHPTQVDELHKICIKYNITLIEDAAEALGSTYKKKHVGTFGEMGTLSFNGNKIITCGGGGMLITNNEQIAIQAKHLTTQAKIDHPWEFNHDQIGYNYRLPNINAALGCAQIESLKKFLTKKRNLATQYNNFFQATEFEFIQEPKFSKSNFWLNAILLENEIQRNDFLFYTNNKGIMTRPAWTLMHKLPMFHHKIKTDLSYAEQIAKTLVNIPSSVVL